MTTPGRRQYLNIKRDHPDAILLFRMGDFYETFDDDARLISKELEIALTSREMGQGQRVPLAGIPYHALEPYLAKLIRKGHRVAICEQVSDPAKSKGIVDRKVVRVVTPGTVLEETLLDQKTNNYLAAVAVDGVEAGLAYVDITTSEFATSQFPIGQLELEFTRISPAEVLIGEGYDGYTPHGPAFTTMDSDAFDLEWDRDILLDHFGVASLQSFGCDGLPLATRAAGAIVDYLRRNQRTALSQVTTLHTYTTSAYMILDAQTRRHLELFQASRSGGTNTTLFSVLDRTVTPMGGRLLRRWLGQPLLDVKELVRRQDTVSWSLRSALRRERIKSLLKSVSDIERLANRVGIGTATPRDLIALASSLQVAPELKTILHENEDSVQVAWLASNIRENQEVVRLIREAIEDDPPLSVGEGKVVKKGFSTDLDALRTSSRDAQAYLAGLQQRERERTGIKSLKVGYNRVFGYYIEVGKSNLSRVPDDYVRRQTLVGGERFITPELKEYESRVLNAEDRIADLEKSLFRQVCRQLTQCVGPVIETAAALAKMDVFYSLAEVASSRGYVRPELNEADVIDIRNGRHPVVERMLPAGGFVSNDALLSAQGDRLVLLTGPNMSGKSTYIRQVAIIVLMAQIGSYVPADSATVGIVDRIFTRVGLQDDLAVGQSTFMVEMVETAAILNHATPRSLIILDEIGRGTSTYDGLAIARSVAEYIHNHPRLGCKTLFATHYHELIQLADFLPHFRNFNVAVSEDKDDVVFLHRIVPGGADKSYGVHVARLAGLPSGVINRAWAVLKQLEDGTSSYETARGDRQRAPTDQAPQLPLLLTPGSLALDELKALDVSSMTPLEAINKLFELQERAKSSS